MLRSGEPDQKVVAARLINRNENLDLALLQAAAEPGLVALSPAQESGLKQTMDVSHSAFPWVPARERRLSQHRRHSGEDHPP